eukprot:UN3320
MPCINALLLWEWTGALSMTSSTVLPLLVSPLVAMPLCLAIPGALYWGMKGCCTQDGLDLGYADTRNICGIAGQQFFCFGFALVWGRLMSFFHFTCTVVDTARTAQRSVGPSKLVCVACQWAGCFPRVGIVSSRG